MINLDDVQDGIRELERAAHLQTSLPARLRKLALISTVAGRTEEERRRVEAMVAVGIAGDHFRASLDRWLTDEFRAANPKLLEAYAARNQANDPACYAAAYRVLAETDLAARLHEITAETLLMTGEHDQGSNPRMARLMLTSVMNSSRERNAMAGSRPKLAP